MPHTPSAYLTAALRSRLIRAAVSEANTTDIACFLEELDLQPTLENTPENLCRYLLLQLSHWAREPESSEKLVRCCEGLAQFYLIAAGEKPEVLSQLNLHLPRGLNFSLISGRLLLDAALFYAPENPFLTETPYLKNSEQVEKPLPESSTPPGELLTPELPLATAEEAPHDRQAERQRIVSQRMNMLKNQLSGRTGS